MSRALGSYVPVQSPVVQARLRKKASTCAPTSLALGVHVPLSGSLIRWGGGLPGGGEVIVGRLPRLGRAAPLREAGHLQNPNDPVERDRDHVAGFHRLAGR